MSFIILNFQDWVSPRWSNRAKQFYPHKLSAAMACLSLQTTSKPGQVSGNSPCFLWTCIILTQKNRGSRGFTLLPPPSLTDFRTHLLIFRLKLFNWGQIEASTWDWHVGHLKIAALANWFSNKTRSWEAEHWFSKYNVRLPIYQTYAVLQVEREWVWYEQWCKLKVVGGRTVPRGGLQGNSHNSDFLPQTGSYLQLGEGR